MNLFYVEPKNIRENSLMITGQEAEHIIKVLRYSKGDRVTVTDGQRNCFECRIQSFQKNTVLLDVTNTIKKPNSNTFVCLCLGIIKKRDRLEFAVEKAIELGVSKIVLFKGERSQKQKVRKDRLEKTAVSAMKQSLRFYLPKFFVESSLKEALLNHAENSTIIVADETKEEIDEKYALEGNHYFLVVGPEGGFSKKEREYLETHQPVFYSLGEKRLRTETASIVMVDRFVNLK